MKTLAIIGSTGSIGKSSLEVLKKNKSNFKLVYVTGNNNFKLLNSQDKIFFPRNIFLFNKNCCQKLKNKKKILSFENFLKKYSKKKIDYVISGISGYDSLFINFKLLKVSKNILLANKETIICGGKIFLNQAKKLRCNILPIDSEHYCVNFFLKSLFKTQKINKIILTASGGPFLNKKIKYNEKIKNVICHPTWKMGNKISVDSSTMANKVLELFEAKVLFDLKPEMLEILIERTSKIHAIIKLSNNLSFMICHKSKMEIPISNCLNLKNKYKMNLDSIKISLEKVNLKKFPLVKIGIKLLKLDHFNQIVFTVLNEKLVNMFLGGKILYGDITTRLVKFFNNNNKIVFSKKKCIRNKSDILRTINFAKNIKI